MSKKLLVLVILLLGSIPNTVSLSFDFAQDSELVELSNYAFAQSVDTAWVRRYDGPMSYNDGASAIAVDGSGNVYVTGNSFGSGTGFDYATIKYDPAGNQLWVRRYDGPAHNDDQATAIAVDGSGNVYVTGFSFDWGTSNDYATIKYYPNGDTAWVRRYNGPGNIDDWAYALAVDSSGNVYVTGRSGGSGTSNDYATLKYGPAGNQLWVRRYNGPGNSDDWANALALDGSGNVYVTGWSMDSSGIFYDYATLKYDPAGTQLWEKRYDGPGNYFDYATDIAVDGSSNVYVTGASEGSGTNYDYATIKYYPNGDTAWVRRYNGPVNFNDGANALAVDSSGNVYVTGYSLDSGTSNDYATLKYDPAGTQLWVRRYNGLGNSEDWAYALALDGSGNVYVTGESMDSSGIYPDYATLKYDPAGNQLWEKKYNGAGNSDDRAYAVAVDSSGNVYVTGGSTLGSGTSYDYATIKYVQTPGEVRDETGNRQKPSEFTLSQNYPNPFNQSTKIEFTLSHSGFVSLNIYDLLGRKIRTLVSENLTPGYKSVFWDGKNESGIEVSSGIYFYQLKIGGFSEAKKLVLLK